MMLRRHRADRWPRVASARINMVKKRRETRCAIWFQMKPRCDPPATCCVRPAVITTNTRPARSPIPGLELQTAQSTGIPGLARTGAHGAGGATTSTGRGAGQLHAATDKDLVRALVGPDAGVRPAILTSQASAQGVNCDPDARAQRPGTVEDGLTAETRSQGINLDRDNLVQGVNADVARLLCIFPAHDSGWHTWWLCR